MRSIARLRPAPQPVTNRDLGLAIGLDVATIVVFVAIGRQEHEDSSGGIAGLLETVAPFVIGLAIAWLIVRAWRRPTKVSTGVLIWPLTVLIGMIVRNLVFDDGTAAAFVIVATLFLGGCLVGWRAVHRSVTRRSRPDR